MVRGGMLSLAAALALALPPISGAHGPMPPQPGKRVLVNKVSDPCPGAPIAANQVIRGSFPERIRGDYVLVPFRVPAGTTAVRVKYCHDAPEEQRFLQASHRLEIGLYDARRPGRSWGEREFRGWGSFSHTDVTVSAQGFSSEDQYLRDPFAPVPGSTIRAFRPRATRPGEWAVELGVAEVVPKAEGDATGEVGWRVEVELSADPRFAERPYRPKRFDPRPAKRRPGWYAGDLHVHSEHSGLGDATMREHLDYGFGPSELDFVSLTDHVTDSAWGEIGRLQDRHPGKLVMRGAEVITYRGHLLNHASGDFVEYRTGRIYEHRPGGGLALRRGRRPASTVFDEIHAGGGFTQVAHATLFRDPAVVRFCPGCAWTYTDTETDWDRVDAYEVHTGPATLGPTGEEPTAGNPFTPSAIAQWDRLRRRGYRIAPVAVSDSHYASQRPQPQQSETGRGATVVYAPELSEAGIRAGIRAGHVYAKLFGPDSPELRLTGTAGGRRAIMGDTLRGRRAALTGRVLGGVPTSLPRTLILLRDGRPIESVPVTRLHFARRFKVSRPGEYRIQVMRGDIADALTNPIRLTR